MSSDRWAPFPVQDWSTMPDPEPAWPDPQWSPPAERRRGWLPLLVVIMVTVLLAGGLLAAERVGAVRVSAASRYLPADGAVDYQRHDTTVGDTTTSSMHVQESNLMTGTQLYGGLDEKLAVAVSRSVGSERLRLTSFWRTTGTMIGNLGSSQQHLRVYRTDTAIALVAESDQGGADIYAPALVELPAEVAPGDTWSGTGTVGLRRYRSELRADTAEPGCLRVSGRIVETTSSGQPGTTREVTRIWCEGRGLVSERSGSDRISTTVEPTSRPSPDPTLRTADEAFTWSDPAAWRRRDFDLLSADATLGTGAMGGASSLVAPVITTSGLVFRVTSGDDIVATTPKTVDRWTSLWRMHPGGTIVALGGYGDVVVASTSRRELVGYSDAGIRLWTIGLDDIAWWAPTRVDARRVAIGDAAGGVRVLDLMTGQVVWRQGVGVQVSAPVLANDTTVVVMDAGGTTTGFAVDTGQQRWSQEIPGTVGAIVGGVAAIRNQGSLEGLDLLTGRHRWLLSQTGTLDALQPFGDVLLAATQLGTVAIDERGTIVRELPAYERLSVVGDVVVGWGVTDAEFRDRDGELLATIDTPDLSLARGLRPTLVYRQGVILFGKDWTFTTWSDEP